MAQRFQVMGMVYARSDSGREVSDGKKVEMSDRPELGESGRGTEGVRLVILIAEVVVAERRYMSAIKTKTCGEG